MRHLRAFLLRLTGLFRRRTRDRELADELESHLQMHIDENIRRGMTPTEARRQALIASGGMEQAKEAYRDRRGLPFLETLWQDIRFALRMLRKSPGFTAVAVLTLALGIGANTAMFSALYGLVLRPLPYADSSRLVMLWDSNRKAGQRHLPVIQGSFPIFESQAKSFEDMAAFGAMAASRDELFADRLWGTEERLAVSAMSPQFSSVLKVTPLLGRTFTASEAVRVVKDDQWQFAHVAILSYSFWKQHYGADPDIIGKTLTMNDIGLRYQYTIVGVMPKGFDFPYPLDAAKPDVWVNLTFTASRFEFGNVLRVVGRLKPGVSLAQAQAEINTIADRIRAQYPKYYKDEYVSVVPLNSDLIQNVRATLWVLLAAFAFILLIGCANVGNLLLVRAVSREREMAIRATLGAGRWTLIGQMLTEGMLLALTGGALGIFLAYASLRAFVALLPQSIYIPRLDSVALDTRMLIFAALLSVIAAGVFSVLPSLRLARPNLNETMKSGSVRKSSPARSVLRRPGSALLVVEVSLALVLLTSALLMLRSMQKLLAVNSQFQPERLLSMDVAIDNAYGMSLPDNDETTIPTRFEQFEDRLAAMPGVEAVALTDWLPVVPHAHTLDEFKADSGGGRIAEEFQSAAMHSVSPAYFDMMDMRLLRGRWLADSDRNGTLPVAVINEAMAEAYWPNRDPLGLKGKPRFRYTDKDISYTIVGIVREPKRFATGDTPEPTVYVSFSQAPLMVATALVRTAANPKGIAAAMREAALQMVPGHMFVGQVQTGEELVSEVSATPRFTTQLLTAFSGLALLLALVGVYGLISYYTSQRTHEIGIRMALGAQRGDVMRLVLREGMLLVSLGVAGGIILAYGLAKGLASLVYGISVTDFHSFAGAAVLLLVVTLAACYIPARRAMKVDPMVALRYE
ncbi:MAG TPA: ABC transporter permease [Candidatus Acidoferrales bacterium]|nr:ABC transporter permease [Candidatus Acidoferrales bacterium]